VTVGVLAAEAVPVAAGVLLPDGEPRSSVRPPTVAPPMATATAAATSAIRE
jgi:hypothetical protein